MRYWIVKPGLHADLFVCKMMGPNAVGTTFSFKERLQYKTLTGAQRAYVRLRENGLISNRWSVTDTVGDVVWRPTRKTMEIAAKAERELQAGR